MLKLFAKPIHGISATCLLGIAFLAECGSIKPMSQDTETKAGGKTSVAPAGRAVAKQKKALVRFLNADPGVARYDLRFENSKTYTHVKYQRLTPYDERLQHAVNSDCERLGGTTPSRQPLKPDVWTAVNGTRLSLSVTPKGTWL